MAVAGPPRNRRRQECDPAVDPSSKTWGEVGKGVQNGTTCFKECLEKFRRDVLKDEAPGGATEDAMLCDVLSGGNRGSRTDQNVGGVGDGGGSMRFQNLYCCDTLACGLWINKTGGDDTKYGQSGNVLGIVNECQSKGYANVLDPGYPDESFECPHEFKYREGEPVACESEIRVDSASVSSGEGYSDEVPAIQAHEGQSLGPTTDTRIRLATSGVPPSILPEDIPLPSDLADGNLAKATSLPPVTSQTPTSLASTAMEKKTSQAYISATNSSTADNEHHDKQVMATGVKATIATASVIGVMVIFGLLLWFHRKRTHERQRVDLRKKITHHSMPASMNRHSSSTGGPGTNSAEVRPPLRLKDRKMLPTPPSSSPKDRPGTFAGTPPRSTILHGNSNTNGFPTSPICAPTTNKLVPRHERTPRMNSPVSAVAGMGKTRDGSSGGSSQESVTYGVPTAAAEKLQRAVARNDRGAGQMRMASVSSVASSRSRPTRSHQGPVEISNIISAGPGPPPSKALPDPPVLVSPASPTPGVGFEALRAATFRTPVSPTSPTTLAGGGKAGHADIGLAIGCDTTLAANALGGHGTSLTPDQSVSSLSKNNSTSSSSGVNHGEGTVTPLHKESQDLRDLTQEYARETKNNHMSWGSWSGGGGVAPITASPRKRSGSGSGEGLGSPVLEEDELERMGGKYK